jgi:hypothetical protein
MKILFFFYIYNKNLQKKIIDYKINYIKEKKIDNTKASFYIWYLYQNESGESKIILFIFFIIIYKFIRFVFFFFEYLIIYFI